ncbi:MAG TPA: response regulator [Hyphomonadaceae bacterium]|jgi:two-component system chemotaxis response regulator CheY|nr:response regulator [Hyphomonadaceae bacterium]
MPAAAAIQALVVDDQLSMRALIANSLKQIGMVNIREAPDGEEGMRELAMKPCHLIISDFNMPKLDGLGFLRAVRAQPAFANTAFIMLTGRADLELVGRARQFGVNNYLVKPFTTTQLKEKIVQVFGSLT